MAAVEAAAFGGTTVDEVVRRSQAEAWIGEVVDGPWWRQAGPPVQVRRPRSSTRSSSARVTADDDRRLGSRAPVEIQLADEQCSQATVAHELAHALAGVPAGHGPRFRVAHVDVVSVIVGRSTGAFLAECYDRFGLEVPPRQWPDPWRGDGDGFRMLT
ncbi:hypothetical protein BH24ACT5_BH24ACT5_15490 [soil metagenome]